MGDNSSPCPILCTPSSATTSSCCLAGTLTAKILPPGADLERGMRVTEMAERRAHLLEECDSFSVNLMTLYSWRIWLCGSASPPLALRPNLPRRQSSPKHIRSLGQGVVQDYGLCLFIYHASSACRSRGGSRAEPQLCSGKQK